MTSALRDWIPLIARLWLASSGVCAGLGIVRAIRFHRAARSLSAADEPLIQRVWGLARRLGLRRTPDVRVSGDAISPMVWPLPWRRMLLLPRGLTDALTPQQLDTVIAHELAHLVRRDAALILSVIAGPDDRDDITRRLPVPDLTVWPDVLRGAHLGVIRDETGVTPAEAAALDHLTGTLLDAGATLHDVAFPSRADLNAHGWSLEVLEHEFKGDLNAYLRTVTSGPRSLQAVIDANDTDPERLLRYGQTLLHAAQGTRGDATEPAYLHARQRDLRLTRTRGFDPLFAQGLDLIVFPGIHGYGLAAKAGYPSLALPVTPAGAATPCGALLVAPAGGEGRLLSLAAELNRLLGGVRFPEQ